MFIIKNIVIFYLLFNDEFNNVFYIILLFSSRDKYDTCFFIDIFNKI